MRDIAKRIGDGFAEILDLTIIITLGGLFIVLLMYYVGRLDQAGWIQMTTLFYDGGLMRMWALIGAVVAKQWADAVFAKRGGHGPDVDSNK